MSTATKKGSLADKAILVNINCSAWGNRTVERDLAEKTAKDQQADSDMFFTTKKLVAREAIKDVTTAFGRFKAHHYKYTLPWLDSGYRVLPGAAYIDYTSEMRKLKGDAEAAVGEFLKAYPTLRAEARKKLGKAFDDSDYPEVSQLQKKWSIDFHFMQIPDKPDIRIDLPATELRKIASDIDNQVASALQNAVGDAWQRLYNVILTLRKKLDAYKVTTDKKGKSKVENPFRDSLIGNIAELCDLLPKLNFTNDADLARLTEEARRSFAAADPEVLRDSDGARSKAIADADKLLARMSEYVGDTTPAIDQAA